MEEEFENVAFIVGAGGVENAWKPIIELLGRSFPEINDADTANCFFARFIYLLRFYATGTFPNAGIALEGMLNDFKEMKDAIASELIKAERLGIIKPRAEFEHVLHKFIFSTNNKAVFFTTNWDTVLDNYINILGECNYPKEGSDIPTFHFHGSAYTPNELYFPSEIVTEPYRNKEDNQIMGGNHGTIWQTLEGCNKTVLYGLSLDPLDAELSQTLAAGWSSPNLREIIVVNPSHEKVCKRVKLLLDKRYPAKVTGYSPFDLTTSYDY